VVLSASVTATDKYTLLLFIRTEHTVSEIPPLSRKWKCDDTYTDSKFMCVCGYNVVPRM